MEIDAADGDRDHDDLAAEPPTPRSRGRRLPGVAAALSRPLLGSGLAHWGGSAPPRDARVEPVDVTGPGTPGKLPAT
ncbi:hypothetical protein ACFW3Z_25695 [Nocardiopsis alba]|uniref:hypothetical protein n=1 Tax=Nocardiopsis alba TaxID=53437 RepID=UPI00366CFAC7